MEPILTSEGENPASARRGRRRRPAAAAASVVVHLALIGLLWSAPLRPRWEFRLAGGRGSVELLASIARPAPTDAPLVERLLPTQVRVEPDHAHIDRETIVIPPEIRPPELHEHHHPHSHEHPAEPAVVEPEPVPPAGRSETATAPASVESTAAAAAATGHDETLPAVRDNPPPAYPAAAYRAGIEGTTLLRIGVRADGDVEFVAVVESSGSRLLDDAAVAAVRRWRFAPGRRGGVAAPFVLRLPVTFRL